METKSLKFELFSGRLWKWFTVNFDSDGAERNRVMEIESDGFKLDVVELTHTHPVLYAEMKKKMAEVAKRAWYINEIPTLSYQAKHKLNPVFFYMLLLIIPAFSFAQAHVDFGGGAGFEKTTYQIKKGETVTNTSLVPVFKISAGYQFGHIMTEAVVQPSMTRIANKSHYLGLKAGYNYRNFIPSIGYLYNYRSADDVILNKWVVGYAVKYQIRINANGGLYAEGMYADKCIQLTAGFHVIF